MNTNNQYKSFAEMQRLFLCSQVNGKAPKSRPLWLWGNLTAEKEKRHRERSPCRHNIKA